MHVFSANVRVPQGPDKGYAYSFGHGADANSEVLRQGKYDMSQPVPVSFSTSNYWSVSAFGFVNAGGFDQPACMAANQLRALRDGCPKRPAVRSANALNSQGQPGATA